ncbi:PhzF family phenazine biosynthesis protein [Psychroflexus planctonicus]|uniref:Isomerase n=1 Tax=Psychroflexus planctonicus TaxID=1526575 RepID=A0ABQ1SBG5_9FLAO|nr:PhzF family phenazine biosynthesis protein [Psychroflexus planctonicus]GGE23431.1 putative isomerase [Psychroflexus planctonicus]
MKLVLYQIDAFTQTVFGGNPAAVIPLDKWLDDAVLRQIATENNLSETAFFVINNEVVELRWFTPVAEVNLCGHATLATAFVLFEELHFERDLIQFSTKSGILEVHKKENAFQMNFPVDTIEKIDGSDYNNLFDIPPQEIWKGKEDVLLLFQSEAEVSKIKPNLALIANTPFRGVIATAVGNEVDFVSRFFTPQLGIDEDPVTGSSHTTLTPFWAKKLDQVQFEAKQISKRVGQLHCQLSGNRVHIAGNAIRYLKGEITIN